MRLLPALVVGAAMVADLRAAAEPSLLANLSRRTWPINGVDPALLATTPVRGRAAHPRSKFPGHRCGYQNQRASRRNCAARVRARLCRSVCGISPAAQRLGSALAVEYPRPVKGFPTFSPGVG